MTTLESAARLLFLVPNHLKACEGHASCSTAHAGATPKIDDRGRIRHYGSSHRGGGGSSSSSSGSRGSGSGSGSGSSPSRSHSRRGRGRRRDGSGNGSSHV